MLHFAAWKSNNVRVSAYEMKVPTTLKRAVSCTPPDSHQSLIITVTSIAKTGHLLLCMVKFSPGRADPNILCILAFIYLFIHLVFGMCWVG